MTPVGAVVIGVGNAFRRDDGVGPAAVGLLRARGLSGVHLVESDGQPTQLLDAWSGAGLAVVVDAVRCAPASPGRLHRIEPPGWSSVAPAGTSTHGLGLADAMALAMVLDRAPRRLVVFGVEAADTGSGSSLSPAVRAALPSVVQAVLTELGLPCREG